MSASTPSSSKQSRLRVGLRFKLIVGSLLLVFIPLVVVWSAGLVEGISHDQAATQVRSAGVALAMRLREVDTNALALSTWHPRLAAFAKEHHVLLRVLDRRGALLFETGVDHAERWSTLQRGWFRRAGDFFFGPQGPPDLRAYEHALPSLSSRREIQSALAGKAAERWRRGASGRMDVFYRAVPLKKGGAVYLARVSRRTIRALYDLRYQLLKLTLLLAGLAGLAGLLVGWRFVRPLLRLQRTIRAYLQTPAELDPKRLNLRRGDEIGDLSRDLEALTRVLKRQLEQTSAVVGDLAHDLKNPIATILATSELLDSAKTIDPDRQRRLARAMRDASAHMTRSVEGLLELARLEERLASTIHDELDLRTLVEEILTSYSQDPASEHVRFHAELGAGTPLRGAPDELRRMIRNLFDNAIAFCESQVAVELSTTPEELVLSVSDDGPGISEGNRDKLFRRFFTHRPDDAPRGTGLGLAIARTIATAHGGELSLAHQGKLSGACFVVRLPLSEPLN
ncbi:MAG: hypothetical protein CSB49_04650 [Proteobacteria bacterium]|nr:MAG: hypothetical protein CSB49_04650 [Pseudomonadota bacterium]